MEANTIDEKETRVLGHETPSVEETPSVHSPQTAGSIESRDVDKAYVYLNRHNEVDETVDLKALRRKIDWRIVPIMFLAYTCQFLDKVVINVSYFERWTSK
jgi:hypothetical protein